MATELVTQDQAVAAPRPQIDPAVLERVLLNGDLSGLDAPARIMYYRAVCDSLGLNPLTKPFDYLKLDGKTVLYAKKDCTEQLRKLHDISVKVVGREMVDGIYVVTAQATNPKGRTDESIGAVPLVTESNGESYMLPPNQRANGIMRAETKAKRRVTLSLCGLGITDESELDTLPAVRMNFDPNAAADNQKPANGAADTPKREEHALPPEDEPDVLALWSSLGADPAKFRHAIEQYKTQMREICGSDGPADEILQRNGMQGKTLRQAGIDNARLAVREMFLTVRRWREKNAPPPADEVTEDREDWLPKGLGEMQP
jgi:hypothetical protein